MSEAFVCDAVRTPIGRYGGALSKVRADDLAALPIKELMKRNPNVDWTKVDDVYYGCVNQAGEDNRNVARMALLLWQKRKPPLRVRLRFMTPQLVGASSIQNWMDSTVQTQCQRQGKMLRKSFR